MKRSVLVALVVSLLTHGLLVFAFVACIEYLPGPDALATLDLSRVELSFAEQVDESAAAVQSLPSPPAQTPPPKPSPDENPPEVEQSSLSPKLGEVRFPEPLEIVSLPVKDEGEILPPQVNQAIKQASNQTIKQSNNSSAAPHQAQIDAPPQPRQTIRPVYPKGSQRRGEQGVVELEIDVEADGTVVAVSVARSSGFPDLDEAAVKAMRRAVFRPARAGSEAVRSTVRQKLEFRLK